MNKYITNIKNVMEILYVNIIIILFEYTLYNTIILTI